MNKISIKKALRMDYFHLISAGQQSEMEWDFLDCFLTLSRYLYLGNAYSFNFSFIALEISAATLGVSCKNFLAASLPTPNFTSPKA